MATIPKHMKAVVFNGPYDITTEDRPTPRVKEPTDVLLKVKYSGLCGTDLHTYRGHINSAVKGQIIGHEFVGTIVEKGTLLTDSDFEIGDEVISTFTTQCGECWYCLHKCSGSCTKTNTFGKPGLDGGQAEYVLVPNAKNTIIKKPQNTDWKDDSVYVLMADIFVTGYYGVQKIINYVKSDPSMSNVDYSDVRILQLGVGPVGLCALRILTYLGFKNVVCVDSVHTRLQEAKQFGASQIINYEETPKYLEDLIKQQNDGVGFDVCLEVVGATSSLRTAYDALRRNGFLCSLGMAHDDLPFNGLDCYIKNVNLSFGRCHVWSYFKEALEVFEVLKTEFAHFIDYKATIDDSSNAFDLFDSHKVNKVVFEFK
ncbi:Piso0_003633 [Millerozyma farinosa CBS 7064]|uniref:Piso0_003633 protein n=1 Tax=Pichia sorbitophila (strain ATCC MYA-4447 / BCRC 22081 / CBS 7064 / NBRC 10061 / NRRL Y-12695) TaxID=559304 RepID=G8YJM1_PICSO|nr:Piso0_003633 [Millerozyma farinosa CBS 7064]CCE81281.1 Piso0_003633 [Millerozyma farinosa CBS 7064]